ncbi:MAG: radical SAM protein [Polyangia bacterium]
MRIYGPVPSRRFGLSLGVDLVPHKTCTLDCIYCQLGSTDNLISEPEVFYPADEILADVEEALDDGPRPDVITLAGSGEPTLYAGLRDLVLELRRLASGVPLLLITNGTLLWREEVGRAALEVDILAPSLDAGSAAMLERINRPHPDITLERYVDGLEKVTNAFEGEIRLEVMLVAGVNDDDESMSAIAGILKRLRYDRIDLNTPVRPPLPERGAVPCDERTLERAIEIFGPEAHPIGKFSPPSGRESAAEHVFDDRDKDVREMLLRRPCTMDDIAASLGMHRNHVIKILDRLVSAGLVESLPGENDVYYRVCGKALRGR